MSRRRKDTVPEPDSLMPRILGMLLMMAVCMMLFYMGFKFLQGIRAEHEWDKLRRQHAPSQQHVDNKRDQPDKSAQKPAQRMDYAFYHALPGDKPVVAGQAATSGRPNTGAAVTGANYRVQVGAFRDQEQANRMRARMILHDYPVVIIRSGTFYLVQIGPYQHKETAQRIQQRLKRDGVDTLLKSYVN